jgi:hypothetical protein
VLADEDAQHIVLPTLDHALTSCGRSDLTTSAGVRQPGGLRLRGP